ncbi:BnaCnng12260D [Brassica napus]|uniref:BnaCnng12260D protein n=1 Tax=Brassica napus TaxID=3708 RepID=A0A078I546_BRANA|nr:BnaCnng12260D [Brassica napus]
MLGFQLDIKKKYELWSLVGPQPELTSFWEICEGWSRDDRKQLAYLAIFTGYIEGRKYSTPTQVSLARLVMELERFENYPWGRVAFKVWVYTALPELGATYGNPLPNNLSPPILAYKGRKGRIQFKEAILIVQLEDFSDDLIIIHIFYLLQTRVINFVQKDIGQMFPEWEFDVEDTPAENIIKLMFVKKPWKWTMDCWKVTGTWVNTKPAVEDSPRPRKKARKEAAAEASEEDIADAMREGFGMCLKEIKYLSERVKALEKKKGTSSQNTTSPSKPTLEHEVKHVCFVYSVWILYIVKVLMGRTREGRAWRRIKVQMCPQLCLHMLVPRKIKLQNRALRMLDMRKRGMLLGHFAVQRLYQGYNPFAPIDKKKLKELADWLKTCPHYRTPVDKKPRKSKTCRLHIDAWINVLRKRYDANPQHFRSERMYFLDHLFAQQWRFNFKDFKDSEPDQNGTIPSFCQSNKRHIVVFDSICSSISPEELDVVMEPFLYMTLKYIECHALGIEARSSQICLVVQFDKEVDTDKFITQIFNT